MYVCVYVNWHIAKFSLTQVDKCITHEPILQYKIVDIQNQALILIQGLVFMIYIVMLTHTLPHALPLTLPPGSWIKLSPVESCSP